MDIWRSKRTPLVVLLIVAGVSAAVFTQQAPEPAEPPVQPLNRRAPIERRITPTASSAAHVLASRDDAALRVPIAATPAGDVRAGGDGPAGYSRTFHPASALLAAAGERPIVRSAGPVLTAPDVEPSSEPPRRHVVVDGDTLTRLAARYLGSSDRYLDLFHANRQVLANPDLLPIGAVLEIPASAPQDENRPERETHAPSRPSPTSADVAHESDDAGLTRIESDIPALVPVPKGLLGSKSE